MVPDRSAPMQMTQPPRRSIFRHIGLACTGIGITGVALLLISLRAQIGLPLLPSTTSEVTAAAVLQVAMVAGYALRGIARIENGPRLPGGQVAAVAIEGIGALFNLLSAVLIFSSGSPEAAVNLIQSTYILQSLGFIGGSRSL